MVRLVRKFVFEAIAASISQPGDKRAFQINLKKELANRDLQDVSLHEVFFEVENVLEDLKESGHDYD